MIRSMPMLAAWTFVFALIFAPFGSAAQAQQRAGEPAQFTLQSMTTPDWGPYPLLMSEFGELCTMCEAYVQCMAESEPLEQNASFSLYYFETKTFWAQIATIWYYFAQWIDPITAEARPATIYRFAKDKARQDMLPTEAFLDKEEAIIRIDNTWIDRDNLQWFSQNDDQIGRCRRLGIPESMAMIEREGPWQLRTTTQVSTQ